VAWTVNEVPRARQVRELGVDGITTDSVHVLLALADRAAG
jgi:glycerophosphoryl diester phosphodiesterase